MAAALAALRQEHGFSLEVVDVDADPALVALYDERVPVLTMAGREICNYFLDRSRLVEALAQAEGQRI